MLAAATLASYNRPYSYYTKEAAVSSNSDADRQLVRTLLPELSEEEVEQTVAHLQSERAGERDDAEPVEVGEESWQETA